MLFTGTKRVLIKSILLNLWRIWILLLKCSQSSLFQIYFFWFQNGVCGHMYLNVRGSGQVQPMKALISESLYGARQAAGQWKGGATERPHHRPPVDNGVIVKFRWPGVPVPQPVWPGIGTVTEPEFGEIHLKIEPNENPDAKWESPSPWWDASKQRKEERERDMMRLAC